MKNIFLIVLSFLVVAANATIISYHQYSRDGLKSDGGIYYVQYRDGSTTAPPETDILLASSIHIDISGDLGEDYVLINYLGTDLFRGTFTTDVTSWASADYTLSPITFTPLSSRGIAELQDSYNQFGAAGISFSFRETAQTFSINGQIAAVPEPMTLGLFGLGLLGLAFLRKKKS